MTAVPAWTEADFQRHVIGLARSLGWGVAASTWKRAADEAAAYGQPLPLDGLIFHPRFSVGSEAGWPDLTLMRRRDGRVLFRELKTDTGRVSDRQRAVLDLMAACGLDVAVWRPADLDQIGRELL